MISLRCYLFGHTWGVWFDMPEDDYPFHKDPDEIDARVAKCTRCGETHVQSWEPPGGGRNE